MDDLNEVAATLDYAKEYGLTVEVIAFAIRYALQHPEATLRECLAYGENEWIK